MTYRVEFRRIDLALLLMAVLWGSNFTVVKIAVRDIPELPFNALRLIVASMAFLLTLAAWEGLPRLSGREWRHVAALGFIGQFLYQLCFMGAVTRTTVANAALIFAFTPIVVALLSAAVGHERVPGARWIGAAVSLAGIYIVIGARSGDPGATTLGNALGVGAMLCWAVYTVGARPLLAMRSALAVTGYSMTIGSLLYLPVAWPGLRTLPWAAVRPAAWAALVLSALLALFVAYMIWYTAVQTIGSTRTSMYSNVTPIAAIAVAAIWLGEPVTARKLLGAAAVIAGLAISRIERRVLPPAEA